jgi:hypothetical protein
VKKSPLGFHPQIPQIFAEGYGRPGLFIGVLRRNLRMQLQLP